MNYQVPQFIEVEDKLLGPFTLKQFVYIAGGAGLSFIVYVFITWRILTILFIAIIMGISLALAFYRINSKPLIYTIEAAFYYWINKKLYLWKKTETVQKKPNTNQKIEIDSSMSVPKLSESKLKDLAWSLNIHESTYSNKNQR